MPSGGALAMTARMSALVMSVAVRGGAADCDEVTACAATNATASTVNVPFLMPSPRGRLLYADDSSVLDLRARRRGHRTIDAGRRRLVARRRRPPSARRAGRHRRQRPDVREKRRGGLQS